MTSGACARLAAAEPPLSESDRLIRFSDVEQIAGLKRTRIYAMIRAGTFPAPYKPGGYASRWSWREVTAWRDGQRHERPSSQRFAVQHHEARAKCSAPAPFVAPKQIDINAFAAAILVSLSDSGVPPDLLDRLTHGAAPDVAPRALHKAIRSALRFGLIDQEIDQ
ncbi:AlpA family phage regulatory protein [uncultured Sphingomonas sp.]|uniref:helix-turn-helix transcriptional regulator n=1 Tax=uncultured Sphingomonas sp. TaxID=158754 RepID=UPI0025990F4C|nr:AlpA family phage regulatory protein [uncultured Sphingomonas sp.]